ncbi:MAG: beta-phosphoglucomutase family hydrolase [Chlorobi bacterium]|nr:beta-phosphoglucomutase family hydrolase [Chlorobiota bacterium]
MRHKYIDAIIFDLDGVITKTAEVHSRAWKKMFDEFLSQKAGIKGRDFREFTPQDYLTYVDGKPRYDGVKSFLDSRKIELAFGTPEDSTDKETVCGLGNRKNQAFNDVLKAEGVEVFPSTVALMERLHKEGIKVGVASSSKNCEAVLKAAKLSHLVETRVDGVVSAEMGLNGKPAPDIFTTAAKNLGADISRSVVVEDASSGVAAGKNGNFGLVLGLARENNHQALLINGADIVVDDIAEFDFGQIEKWFEKGMEEESWKLRYHDYIPEKEKSREALLSVGNGFFGCRGAMEESSANKYNYPGTYIAGMYNRLTTTISGRDIVNEDFVNVPNWLVFKFKIDDDPWFNPNDGDIAHIDRSLNLKTGLLSRKMKVIDELGRETLIESERIASMYNPHLAAIRYKITALNYSACLSLASAIDGTIINEGVERYKSLNSKHLESIGQGGENNISYLEVKTNQSDIHIATVSKLICDKDIRFGVSTDDGIVYTYMDYDIQEGKSIEFQKLVSIHSSLGTKGDLKDAALSNLSSLNGFDAIFSASKLAWAELWTEADIKIEGDRKSQGLLRLHLYHLLVSASNHNQKIDASITARGLHGEAYRGHIFWDELFILPFYNIHFPKTARELLMYRYRRLQKAKDYAKEHGYLGAMYPWQSGSNGSEETQVVHLNPVSGEWGEDHSSLQRHVSLAIAYNVWQYVNTTSDIDFLKKYGAEMILEIARFWASKCQFNKKTKKYSIGEVMGPDEFHESYPGAEKGGLKDNAYTNLMVAWLFGKVPEILETIWADGEDLLNRIKLTEGELELWSDIQHNLNLLVKDDIISQYDGYFDLKELDWDYYMKKYGDVYRMDRLLKAEGKSADDYKVAKQADMLMTFYNLNKETVDKLLEDLSYKLSSDYLNKNLEYYLKRTSHGSTLSRVVHAQLAQIIGNEELSWELYSDALASDFDDIQGGTTAEGIHAGVMAGTIMIAISTFAGVDTRGEILNVNPKLPGDWKAIRFKMKFKNANYSFAISKEKVEVETDKETIIKFKNEVFSLKANSNTLLNL